MSTFRGIANFVAAFEARVGLVNTTSGLVDRWTDLTGNGHHLVGTTITRPTFVRGADGAYYLSFDDSNDYLQTAAFSAPIPQPCSYFYLAKMRTEGADEALMSGLSAGARHAVRFSNATNAWFMFAGTGQNPGEFPVDFAYHKLVAVFNGASSTTKVDNATEIIAAGTVGTQSIDGITLGAAFDGSVPGPWDIKAFYMLDKVATAAEISTIYGWMDFVAATGSALRQGMRLPLRQPIRSGD